MFRLYPICSLFTPCAVPSDYTKIGITFVAGISFTPREIGEHVVSVKRMGKHIANSPFKITVGEREVGDAKKVKVSGAALHEGKTHVDNFFTVDTRNAGQ